MNELTKGSLSKGVFVSSLASVSVICPRIKLPYPNSFITVDFWIDSFRYVSEHV